MDGYSLICEIFNIIHNEKVLDKFSIMNLSIYRKDKLITKRYLTARLVITNKKLVIDRLSSINPLPVLIDPKGTMLPDFIEIWKSKQAFDLPYRFIDRVEYNKELRKLIIYTLINKTIILLQFRDNEKTCRLIINKINKIIS